jgi:hypothetical protein
MQVFEIRYPGTWFDGTLNSERVSPLLVVLEGHLADASVGLALFEEARSRPRSGPGGVRRQQAALAISRAMESQLPGNLTAEQRFLALRDIPDAADLQVRRQEWAAGRLPDSYEHRLPFIHAHTVVYALDGIGKALDQLAGISGLPAGVTAARDGYRAALPELVAVRDSAHHTENRAQGLDRRGQPLVLQPISNQMIEAPNGALVLSSLNGNKLAYTASDGYYKEAEISPKSVKAAQDAIQQTIDAFSWKGPAHLTPA